MKRSSVSSGGAGCLSTQEMRSQDLEKAELYTPQTTSGHSSRTRQLGKCSRSEMKDPRPLNDKAFIHECIKQLYKFLTENGYKHRVSIKSLQAPSTKDFLRIFAFLYGFLCPSYKIPDRKFEEEIPRIFKDLGYPFALSKSSLYAVGAPHTWPHIVAALVWLIDCIKIHCAMKESTTCGEETEDGIKHNKLFLDYTIKCYEKFMSGADTFEDENAELQLKLKDLYKVDASKLESLAAENKALNEQIARLEQQREKEPNCLESLKKLKASLQSDVEKYKAYLSSLESHSSFLDEKMSGLDEEISRLELQCEAMRQENARLQNIVDNQKYSVTDIERINHEKNELQQTINKLTKDLETEQQQMWNEELKYARGKEAIEAQLADYHKLARKLKLIPKGAENSKGYDFEIKFNPLAGAKCLAKYRAQIYVPLKELLNESEEEISKVLNKKIVLEDTLEQLDTMKAERRRNVRMLKEELQKLDDLYQQAVKEAEEQDEKCARELESLEKHKHLLESAVNKGLSEAMDELEAVQREYQLVLQSTTEEKGKVTHDLLHLLEMVATHVGALEKHLEEQIAKADEECEGCMSEDLLKNIKEIAEKYKSSAALFKTPVE